MAHTIQRLTMYALISALENDLRDFISLHVAPLVPTGSVLPDTAVRKATSRFSKDNSEGQPDLDDLLSYLDLGDVVSAIRTHDSKLDSSTRIYINRFYMGIESVIPIRNRVMHSRPLEYNDLSIVTALTSNLENSHRALWANVRSTQRTLERTPEFVTTISIPESLDENTKILHNLPQVEFDDTGFMGRQKELEELKHALLGSYPVVTVVGEGGLGKTAIALKACYDFLDENDAGFDAIVWTTAKTTKLTAHEVQLIDGAISSSLGIIESATSLLGRQSETSAMDDLILHLQNNKILLVIDNLETVIDQTIRELVRRVPQGSRILFTTRIGLGAFDFPVPLARLGKKEAGHYFRRAARAWGAPDMAALSQQITDGYCERLQYNPLFIKCFMQSIRAGNRPSAIANDPNVLLQFCLQNVFNSLNLDSKVVAGALASVGGPQSVASIAFYTDIDSIGVQSALSHLITSNLVSSERGRSSEDEDRYVLSSLARLYMQKFIRPSKDEQKKLISKQNALWSAQEEYTARAGSDMFDINYVFVRDKDDYIVARILTKAIELAFREKLDDAEELVSKASDLSPNYFEVHRVKAFLFISREDFFGAEAEYEAAISLASDRAPLRLWFGGFLSRNLGNMERALEQLLIAEQLAPLAPIVKIECARVFQYVRKFDEAGQRLRGITDLEKLSSKTRRVHLDLTLQNSIRKADHLLTLEEFDQSLSCLEEARSTLEAASPALIDKRTIGSISRAWRVVTSLRRAFKNLPQEVQLKSFEKWLREKEAFGRPLQPPGAEANEEFSISLLETSPVPNRGRLSQIHETYAFVVAGSDQLFFHRGNWIGTRDFKTLVEGEVVEFEYGSNDKGLVAFNVRLVDDSNIIEQEGTNLLGEITSLKTTFGFISLDKGSNIFFHRSNCAETTNFKRLFIGQRVRCIWRRRQDGKIYADKVESYSGGV